MATKQVKKENSVVPKELGCTTSTKDSILQKVSRKERGQSDIILVGRAVPIYILFPQTAEFD